MCALSSPQPAGQRNRGSILGNHITLYKQLSVTPQTYCSSKSHNHECHLIVLNIYTSPNVGPYVFKCDTKLTTIHLS